jgi:hypothetical protein
LYFFCFVLLRFLLVNADLCLQPFELVPFSSACVDSIPRPVAPPPFRHAAPPNAVPVV